MVSEVPVDDVVSGEVHERQLGTTCTQVAKGLAGRGDAVDPGGRDDRDAIEVDLDFDDIRDTGGFALNELRRLDTP